jgi:hypothetical protein
VRRGVQCPVDDKVLLDAQGGRTKHIADYGAVYVDHGTGGLIAVPPTSLTVPWDIRVPSEADLVVHLDPGSGGFVAESPTPLLVTWDVRVLGKSELIL